MKNKILLMILAVALLVLSACDGGTDINTGQTGFVGGFKGIEISFATNAPPDRVSDAGQEEFDVVVELINRGEHEVLAENIFVKLEGFTSIRSNT